MYSIRPTPVEKFSERTGKKLQEYTGWEVFEDDFVAFVVGTKEDAAWLAEFTNKAIVRDRQLRSPKGKFQTWLKTHWVGFYKWLYADVKSQPKKVEIDKSEIEKK